MINKEMLKKTFYIFFSAVFLIVSVGIVVWIVRQEIEKGARGNQEQMTKRETEDENVGVMSENKEESGAMVIESKDDANQTLSEIDNLMETASGENFEDN